MDSALTGFVGVLAGALTTIGVETWTTGRQRHNDALAAARLVYGSLAEASVELENLRRKGNWPAGMVGTPFAANVVVWHEQRERLARVLDPAGFQCVNGAFATLVNLNEAVERSLSEEVADRGAGRVLADANFGRRVALLGQAELITEKAGQRWIDRPFAGRRARRRLGRLPALAASARVAVAGETTDDDDAQSDEAKQG